MTDTLTTIGLCYAAVGVYVWLAGDGCGDAVNQSVLLTSAQLVAVTLAWPWVVRAAVKTYRGR